MSPCRVGDVFEGGAGGGQKAGALRKELGDLERAEKCLDDLILSSTVQLKQLTEYEDNQRYPLHAAPRSSTCPFGALLDAATHTKHPSSWCCSDPWPHAPRWATWRIRTSAQLAVSRTRQSLLSRLQPTQNWRFQTQKGWDGRSLQLPEGLERVRVVANSDVCVCDFLQQGSLQIYLKSKNGPIEVYLCPEAALEDASPVKSASTPKKDPQTLCPPTSTSTAPPSCSIKEEPVESKPSSGSILKYFENPRFVRNCWIFECIYLTYWMWKWIKSTYCLSPSCYSSHSWCSLQLLHPRRRRSPGPAAQPSADHRGPAPVGVLRPGPQHSLRQLLSAFGPRRLPLESGRRRGGVGLFRLVRSRGSVVELRDRGRKGR